jgi:hypothetical protein
MTRTRPTYVILAAIGVVAVILIVVDINTKHVKNGCATPDTKSALSACNAYRLNAPGDRVWFYEHVTSTNPADRDTAAARLARRYSGQALAAIKAQVAGWPPSDQIIVSRPDIVPNNITLSAADDMAVIRGTETWLVRTRDGRVLFSDPPQPGAAHQPHTVTLAFVPGIPGVDDSHGKHWVITAIS